MSFSGIFFFYCLKITYFSYIFFISICFVRQWLKYSKWIWRFVAREGKKVKYVFANTTAKGKKVKSFTSEHFQVSNLINYVTLRIKVKKKYSEWIWRFDAREGQKVKSPCKYPGSGKNRAHQTRRSERLFRLGFNEIAQFLSKSEDLVALSVFSSQYFFHQ